jgi:hypothetical protein
VSPLEVAGLAAAGALAGLVSTVASVASVVSYPVLLAIGLPPLAANVTNTVALLFTGAGAAAGSRPELAGLRGGRSGGGGRAAAHPGVLVRLRGPGADRGGFGDPADTAARRPHP